MGWITSGENWIALATLTALELVLGVDNVIFISILAAKLPRSQQARARQIGLGLAMLSRIALLLSITWVMGLTAPLVVLFGHPVSARDLILFGGGLFLIAKSTYEIHAKVEDAAAPRRVAEHPSFAAVVAQIIAIDIVFSLDSVITAVGMVDDVAVMVIAVILAIAITMAFAGPISDFVERHPTFKMLALAFLLLIGVTLIADSVQVHIPRGYIYFAMAFSLAVELLNLRLHRRRRQPDDAT